MKKLLLTLFTCIMAVYSQHAAAQSSETLTNDYSDYFREAYQQFPDIPRGILEAVAYGNTRIYHITHIPDEESCTGIPFVYGVMGLTLDGKNYFKNNLAYVSSLSGVPVNEIIGSPKKNILAYAQAFNSVMGVYESQRGPETKDDEIIFNTLIELSELPHDDEGQLFALHSQLYMYFWFLQQPEFQVTYGFPAHNFDVHTLFGENNYRVLSSEEITFTESEISDTEGHVYRSGDGIGIPTVQSSDYGPAIWDAAASCNYSSRNSSISAVTIHTVQGSYASCISWFKNCQAQVSAHYVVRSSDGQVTQMVLESKKAWHVGNNNPFTIGIEHEGYIAQTGWYTTAMYQSSANLVKDICNSGYGINPTACYSGASCSGTCLKPTSVTIKGHQMFPNQSHTDPGPNWNWGTYYNLINNTSGNCGTPTGLNATAVTSNSATLNWTAVSGATSYNITYTSTYGIMNTTSTTNSVALTSLIPATTYQFKVQAVCTTAGAFSGNTSFTTLANPLTNDNCSGATIIFPNPTCTPTTGNISGATQSGLPKASCDAYSGSSPVMRDVWYQFTATASSHSIKVVPSSNFDAVLALYTSCSGGQIGCSDNGGGSGASETISATNLTVGNTYYIRVYSYGAVVPSTTTFDLCVVGPTSSSCGTPSGLSATNVSTTGATLNWNSVAGANSYNIEYKTTSSSAWTSLSVTSTSTTLTGLTAGTPYEFHVQAVCSSNNAGNFSSPVTFTTLSSNTNSNNTLTIGTATSPYSAHPYGTVYMDERVQYIIPKSDIVNAGWTAATPYLKSLAFFVSSVSPQAMGNFTIKIAHTTNNSFTNTSFLAGTSSITVYTGTVNTTQGWNTYNFTTPFHYNGTGNLLITICWDNSSFTVNSAVYAGSYSTYVALYHRQDKTNGGVCSNTTGTRSFYRPNTKLEFSATTILSNPQGYVAQPNNNENNTSRSFEIYPNPLDGNVLSGVMNGTEEESITLKIYDLLGREMFSEQVSIAGGGFSVTLERERFKTGVYTVIGISETEQFAKKLVIK